MKTQNLIAVMAAAVLLAACIPSVNPFYQDKDLVFDPHLVGQWQEKETTDNPEVWTFEQTTNKSYDLVIDQQGKTGKFSAHLFKLKDAQFLDLIPTDCNYATNQADLVAASMFPGHLLMRVAQIEPELKFAFCDFDWLGKYLETNSAALAHHGESGGGVLTASTDDLQKFILNRLGTNELFKEYATMARRPKP
jgi:hypothetical protein